MGPAVPFFIFFSVYKSEEGCHKHKDMDLLQGTTSRGEDVERLQCR